MIRIIRWCLIVWIAIAGVGLVPSFAARIVTVEEIAQSLRDQDSTFLITQPARDIVILSSVLTDHILPSLAPAQLLREATILQIPSDLLSVSQLLLLRRTLYPQSICLLISHHKDPKTEFVILSVTDEGKPGMLLDRRPLFRGTVETLVTMNSHTAGEGQQEYVFFSQIEASLENPETIRAVEQIIERQEATHTTEIGGFMTIEQQPGKSPLLHFHPVQTLGDEFLRTFDAAGDDMEGILELMRSHPAEFAIVPHQYRSTLATMDLAITREKKEKKVREFADIFRYISRNSYCPDIIRYVMLMADPQIRGFFAGDFHVHPRDNDVSYQDKLNSAELRVIVIIPRQNGFDIADLSHADPNAPPEQVARYRKTAIEASGKE